MSKKEVVLGEFTAVSDLADALAVPAARVIEAGFQRLGLLLTIHEHVAFEAAALIASAFGFRARRQ
jgi:hypothetical protein